MVAMSHFTSDCLSQIVDQFVISISLSHAHARVPSVELVLIDETYQN